MRFSDPLLKGVLIRRYKRFLADVEIAGGELVVAHCANPGSMLGLIEPGAEVWLSPANNPARKLAYSLEILRAPQTFGGSLVGVHTSRANALAADAIEHGAIPELRGYASVRREVRYDENARIDLLLEDPDRPPCYVEVKSVTLKRDAAVPGLAEFPDSVTARGTKHLGALARVVADGARAVMLYVAQRTDCGRFSIAADIDPAYWAAFCASREAGVEALCYACKIGPEAIELDGGLRLPISDPN